MDREKTSFESDLKTSPPASERGAPPLVDVRDLVGAGREAVLLHAGDRYRLRITANNKLILTK